MSSVAHDLTKVLENLAVLLQLRTAPKRRTLVLSQKTVTVFFVVFV